MVSICGFSFKGRWRAIKSTFNGIQGIAAVWKIFPTWFKEAAAQSFWSRHYVALVLKPTIKLIDRNSLRMAESAAVVIFYFLFFSCLNPPFALRKFTYAISDLQLL